MNINLVEINRIRISKKEVNNKRNTEDLLNNYVCMSGNWCLIKIYPIFTLSLQQYTFQMIRNQKLRASFGSPFVRFA